MSLAGLCLPCAPHSQRCAAVAERNGSISLLAGSSAVVIAGTLMLGWLFGERATV
jgi:hypothetical protein